MLKLKCPKHPRFAGKTSPRASCPVCIELYQLRLRAIREHVVVVEATKAEATHE